MIQHLHPRSVGTGVKVEHTKLFTQGGLVNTDNSLDLAIDGSGFFKIHDGGLDILVQVFYQEMKKVF